MTIEPTQLRSAPAPEARFTVRVEEPEVVPVPEPAAPPPAPDPVEVAQATSRRVAEMTERGRELHFEQTDAGMRIEVYDGLGRLVQAIPPNEALAKAVGRSTWRA